MMWLLGFIWDLIIIYEYLFIEIRMKIHKNIRLQEEKESTQAKG